MFDLKNQLGIKSYSFRHLTANADAAAAVKECEVNVIDLSGCHVNYDDAAAQKRTFATYDEAGVRISGIGVVGFKNDPVSNRKIFDFARLAGCRVISCSLPPDDHVAILRGLEGLAEEYDVVLALHNHGGKDWLGNAASLRYVLGQTTNRVGLCIDTAWCLQAGDDPVKWLELFGERTYAAHFKDFIFHPRGGWEDVIVGQGALNLPEFLAKFATLPAIESAVVEFEGENAVGRSRECVRAIRALL